MNKKFIFFSLLSVLLSANAYAQLNRVFGDVFSGFLKSGFARGSPGQHGLHFLKADTLARGQLSLALNSLVASNVSSFPLSSTAAGVTFDFSTGQPVSIAKSLGPIFAETAATLGRGKVNLGYNYTYLNLSRFRGLPTRDIRFTFTHEDVGNSGVLGDNINESDLVDIFLDLDVSASVFAFFATAGVTNNLDVGVAVPIANISLSGNARAVVNSFTFARNDSANHHFGTDNHNPQLTETIRYNKSTAGLGDIAVRLKYGFLRGTDIDLAVLLDVRVPTGDDKDFLGMGKSNLRFSWILSKKIGDFTPHLNLGYDRRSAGLDSDELEVALGFDQKVALGVTFAAEFLSEFDLNRDEAITLLPGSVTIIDQPAPQSRHTRIVDLSNVPERSNDHTMNAALGFRIAPSEHLLMLGNVLLPLNDGGLRSSVAPTLGVAVSF
jgi:hypothetical protein